MRIISLRINSRNVSRLTINGLNVLLGNASCDALCFTALEAGSTVKLTKVGSAPDVNLQTSTNGSSWNPYTIEDTITLANIGDKVYFKAVGSNTKMSNGEYSYNNFVMTGKISASGNVNSLLEEEEAARTMSLEGKDYCYSSMFKDCKSLTQAPELPATTLAYSCYKYMFLNCSSLTQAPVLPATTLAKSCYSYMFFNCTSLTQAQELHATTLADWCYSNMFNGCTSLTQSPVLTSTTLASNCYSNMFYSCTSLTQAPELPSTTLATGCYLYMFGNCKSLTQAPELPATTLADSCYNSMFSGCTSLINAPELPATTLAQSCYENMFSGCTSLTQAPALPATKFSSLWCYRYMFLNCSNLNYVKVMLTNWAGDATDNWLPENVGTFECPKALIDNTTERTTSTVPSTWNMVAYDVGPVLSDALCFTAEEAGSTVKFHKVFSAPDVKLQTSTNGSSWTPYTVEDVITLTNIGDKVYFKAVGSNNKISDSLYGYNKFNITGKIAASGNVNSLLEEDEETARTMSLAGKSFCYGYMFRDETGLTQAPELPATTLASDCYVLMFRNCVSLSSITKVAFTAWGGETTGWLEGVAATGTLRCPQALIDNTTERGSSTVPETWTMVAV